MTAPDSRDSVELLPCPFCGSDQVSLSEGETGDGQPWPYVECESCAATAMPDNWNNRQALARGPQQAGGEDGYGAGVTPDAALAAIDSLDDYARMDTGVAATGAVGMLQRFVSQYRALHAELQEAQEMIRSTYGERAALNGGQDDG